MTRDSVIPNRFFCSPPLWRARWTSSALPLGRRVRVGHDRQLRLARVLRRAKRITVGDGTSLGTVRSTVRKPGGIGRWERPRGAVRSQRPIPPDRSHRAGVHYRAEGSRGVFSAGCRAAGAPPGGGRFPGRPWRDYCPIARLPRTLTRPPMRADPGHSMQLRFGV